MKKYFNKQVITTVVIIATLLLIITGYNKVFTTEVRSFGGTFTEGMVGTPRFINPVLALSNADRDLTELTFSSLIDVDHEGTISYQLASNLEISSNQKQYTLTIHPQARFSDGTPITADDVVFTVEKIQSPFIKSPLFNRWVGVEVEAIEVKEVRFTLNQPYADFIYNLTIGVLPKHLWKDVSDEEFSFSTLNINPVSSGYYQVQKVLFKGNGVPSEFQLTANQYAHQKPYVADIMVKLYETPEDLLKAYRQGTVQGAYGLSIPSVTKVREKNIQTGTLPRTFGIFFNTENNKSLLDTQTRIALSSAINREQIVNEVFSGYAKSVDNPLGLDAETKYDKAKAQALLEQAGWKQNSEGQYMKSIAGNNTPLSFSLAVPDIQEVQDVARIIIENLSEIGVWVTITTYEEAELNNEVIRSRSYDALLFGYVLEKPSDTFAFWHSSQQNDPGLNISMYSDINVDARLINIRTKQDREEDIKKFNELWLEDMPAIFLYTPYYVYLAPEPFTLPQNLSHRSERFNEVREWYLKTRHVWNFLIKE